MSIASKKFAVAALAGAMAVMTTAAFAGDDFPSMYPQGYKGNGTSYTAEKASCKATGSCNAEKSCAAAKPKHHKKHKAAAPAAAPAPAAKHDAKPAEKPAKH